MSSQKLSYKKRRYSFRQLCKMKGNNRFLYSAVCASKSHSIFILTFNISYFITDNLIAFTAGIALAFASPVIPKLNGMVDPQDNPLPQPLTPQQESLIAGILSLGVAAGPIITAYLSDKIGRKNTMLIFTFPVIVSFLIMAYANTVPLFYLARFLQGVGISVSFSVLPMYTAEIAEDHNRGTLGCTMSLFCATGLLCSYAIGPFLCVKNFCLLCTLPPLIFAVTLWFIVPESPHYLLAIKRNESATEALMKFRGKTDVEKEILEIAKSVEDALDNNKGTTIINLLHNKNFVKALMISTGLVCLQQTIGINAVLSYMQTIFSMAGSTLSPEIASILVSFVQVLAVAFSTALVDRLGRRILLLVSATGCCLSECLLAAYFHLQSKNFDVSSFSFLPIASLLLYIISFNLGFASLPWAISGELFTANLKSLASTVNCSACFLLSFVTTTFFPYLNGVIGIDGSFLLFSVFCVVSCVFIYFVVPETKGKSFYEIQQMLNVEAKK